MRTLLVILLAGALAAATGSAAPALEQGAVVCTDPYPEQVIDPVVSPLVFTGGTVVARVLVGIAGNVRAIDVLQPYPALDEPVTDALKAWRFAPARCGRDVVERWTTVAFHIVLIRTTAPPPFR